MPVVIYAFIKRNVHAVFAAKEGAIVATEGVVDTEFMKSYPHFVKIPGYPVKAVCPAHLRAHPS